ncbi:MAG: MFS transporter [Proteobacteria bacterium]|nr:MFS transporter [Pseudomonadota bacterium]
MTASALSAVERRRSLAAVMSCVGVSGLCFGLTSPLLTLLLERQGVDAVLIGLSAATSSLAVLFIGPLVPALVARLGTLGALYSALAVAVAALLMLPLFPNVYAWFPIRFVLGAAIAVQWIASEIWVNRISTEEGRGTTVGIYSMLFAVGFAIGPLLIVAVGSVGWAPFLVAAALLAVSALPLTAARGLAPRISARGGGGLLTVAKHAPLLLVCAWTCGAVVMSVVALLPIYGLRSGLDEDAVVAMVSVFLIGNAALQIPIGWLSARMPRRSLLAGLAVLGIVGPLLLAPALASGFTLWILLFLWGGAVVGFYTVGLVALGERFPGSQIAAANAAFVMVFEFGSVTGPALTGAALAAWTPHGFVVALAGICVFFLALLAFLRRAGEPEG